MKFLIKNAEIFTPSHHIPDGYILTDGPSIIEVDHTNRSVSASGARVIDAQGRTLIPGLVDVHIHGAGGHDMCGSGVRQAARYLADKGITSFLATTHFMLPRDELITAVSEIAEVIADPPEGARILGIHMEGPWVAADRSPFSDASLCYPLTRAEVQCFLQASGGHLRMLTFAPELGDALDVIPDLVENCIIASIGHTNADYETALKAIDLGITHSTHTFNAMQPFHHRQPGTLGAIFERPEVHAELIADGFHVHPSAMRLLLKAKGTNGVCLVSDAVPLAGLPAGTTCDWYGFQITTDGKISTLLDGRPAGAYQLLLQAVRQLVQTGTATFMEALWMASTVPARILNQKKGELKAGYDADLVLLGEDGEPVLVLVDGKPVFSEIG